MNTVLCVSLEAALQRAEAVYSAALWQRLQGVDRRSFSRGKKILQCYQVDRF